MLMRVAIGIHLEDIDAAIETYNLMSERWFTHASPTMFNAGTPNPQMSSCFLLSMVRRLTTTPQGKSVASAHRSYRPIPYRRQFIRQYASPALLSRPDG